ncbi:hypothetical protein BMH32_13240 [Leucobacter sp. OLJS4]|nr:hypothetical protein BMH25_02495 [Leucobacter sp. OLCALW19]PII89023.1 hypothetical protein BMH26_04100 [Leucobacter sp. OLTLW20]PII93568.1 hypothetical protein BMH27_03500 [Leucobacter sp. OLAS13]PII98034.1 hypothetical protein BMH29_09245 [Leucobacter sp. OLDS2]PIJ02668.1 hypothetical protein BMH28_05070 [Leucobacter sp. OLCS4]PIJ03786.1 hypothetical protein BMH31_06445 [Leucobacter sp. OLIS6]PIJ06775.1 hypothetical protein BMH32_13240 [Leucobacter sp. OLJS4]PIJ29410.1 hypothetical prote
MPLRAPEELHVTAPQPLNRSTGRGVIGHRTSAQFAPVRSPSGLPCVPASLALLQSAATLPFLELVVALDHLRRPRRIPDGASLTESEVDALLIRSRTRGIKRLRDAWSVSRLGAESRMESHLHYVLASMGLDDLELQADLHDRAGAWIGRFDQVDRARRRILEYDGEQHRTDRQQYLRDLTRLDRAREIGYKILRAHAEDFHPQRLHETEGRLCAFLGRAPRPLRAGLARRFSER